MAPNRIKLVYRRLIDWSRCGTYWPLHRLRKTKIIYFDYKLLRSDRMAII
jgi:hypothetical protein